MKRLLLLVAAAAACAGPKVQSRLDTVRETLDRAQQNGAYWCAPRELATGRSHLRFGENELAQGSAMRASEHADVAEVNAWSAVALSPAGRCGAGGDIDGDGIADTADACVLEPEDFDQYLDSDGCPEIDNDLDTLVDTADQCPNEPEDFDGFEDQDGCPDADNDKDRLLDVADQCPNEPGPESNQGCPRDYQDVELTASAIVIYQKIHFEFDKDVIRSESFPVLNTVAQVMKDYPSITIEVQGHTDSKGSDRYNERLSDARAKSVRRYLTQQGVDGNRLTAKGYGEHKPITTNATSAGRALNRRVEFVRTDSDATPAVSAP